MEQVRDSLRVEVVDRVVDRVRVMVRSMWVGFRVNIEDNYEQG